METFIKILEILKNPQFYFEVLRLAAPLLFAAMGCVVAQKAGATNIGLEGIMLMSALTAVLVQHYTKSIAWAFVAAVVIGLLMGLFIALFALKLRVDIILVGIAVNLIGGGATVFTMFAATGDRTTTTSINLKFFPKVPAATSENPFLDFLAKMFTNQSYLTYLSIVLVFVVAFFLFKTRLGLRIRAVGENPDAAASVGIGVNKIKTVALAISGVFGGLAGAFMTMEILPYFTKGMAQGRGFIALAACAMGGAAPGLTAATCLLFGFFYAFSNYGLSLGFPASLISMLPYVVVIIGLVIVSISIAAKKKKRLSGGASNKAKKAN